MKNTKWLALVAAVHFPFLCAVAQAPAPQIPSGPGPVQGTAPVAANISPATAEVVRLAEAGTSEDVILAYVQNAQSSFNLSSDNILYLKDVGLTSPVITAMLNRDSALRNQTQQYRYDQKLYPPANPAPNAPPPLEAPPVAPPASEPSAPPPTAVAAPPTYVSNPPPEVNYFYNDLSPYGAWVDLEGVGWCWQPRVVVINRAWRPYCDSGHWIYTDAGWFWQSDYSWGWAPFHYGRWQLHERCGWVWQPDAVWAPAWVSWRVAGDHCGWAPLPPRAVFDVRLGWRFNGVSVGVDFDFGLRPDHFTFVALHDFTERDLGHRRLAPTEVKTVYNQTTIINNYVVNNNTIVNRGLPVERVAAATHKEIRKAAIRDMPASAGKATPASERREAVVYRPRLVAPAKPAPMVAQRVDERHPVVHHAAIAPVTVERKAQTVPTSGSGPALGPRRSLREGPTVSAPSGGEKAPSYSHNPAAPSVGEKAPSYSRSPSAPRANPPAAPAVASSPDRRARSDTPYPGSAEVGKPPVRPPLASRPEEAAHSETLHAPVQGHPGPAQRDTQTQNPHVYYPKTYQQSADIHSRPQSNQRDPASPSRSGHDQGSSSKKNEP